eukprot:5085387-Prymnesium_polylepis.1
MVEDRHLRAALRERVGAALEEKVDELVVVALGRVEDGRLARLVLQGGGQPRAEGSGADGSVGMAERS